MKKKKKSLVQKCHDRGKSVSGRIVVKSEEEMMKEAAKFARTLKGGEAVLLEGELGTGKTTFVRGLARALGVKGAVRSPTFTLLNVYQGKTKKIVHMDVYRLTGADWHELGIEEFLVKDDTIVVVEWGEKVAAFLKNYHRTISINFEHGIKSNERIIIYDL